MWCRLAATTPIQLLGWEPPYAEGVALKRPKKKKKKKIHSWEFHCGLVVTNLSGIHEDVGSIPGLTQWVGDLVLLRAVMWVSHAVCSYGCGVSWWLQL